jgi:hypothetical protein
LTPQATNWKEGGKPAIVDSSTLSERAREAGVKYGPPPPVGHKNGTMKRCFPLFTDIKIAENEVFFSMKLLKINLTQIRMAIKSA